MTGMEARKFFDEEVLARWPNWGVTEIEIGDWVRMLCRYEWDDSKYAIRQYAENKTRYEVKTPSVGRFKSFMANRPNRKEKTATEWAECKTFVQNIKTGIFYDVVLSPPNVDPDMLSRAAENMRVRLGEVYGGDWLVYKEMTRWRMWGLQKEIRAAITKQATDTLNNAEIESQLDSFCKPVPESNNGVLQA